MVNVVQIVVMPWLLVESPTFFILSKNDENTAKKNLKKIFKEDFVQEELDSLKKEKFVLDHGSMKFWAFMKQYRRPMVVAIDISLINQLSGIGAYDFFSNQMFINSGLTLANAQLYTTLTGTANILGALLTFYLVKKFTPKQVFMGGVYIILATLVATALTIILDVWIVTRYLIIFYCFIYSATLGSVVFILVPSLVPALGCNIAFCFNGFAIFVVGYTFLYIKESTIGAAGAFLIYAGFCAISIVHLTIELPETKGKTLDEVMLFFVKKPAPVTEQAVDSVSAPVVTDIEPEISESVAAREEDNPRGDLAWKITEGKSPRNS